MGRRQLLWMVPSSSASHWEVPLCSPDVAYAPSEPNCFTRGPIEPRDPYSQDTGGPHASSSSTRAYSAPEDTTFSKHARVSTQSAAAVRRVLGRGERRRGSHLVAPVTGAGRRVGRVGGDGSSGPDNGTGRDREPAPLQARDVGIPSAGSKDRPGPGVPERTEHVRSGIDDEDLFDDDRPTAIRPELPLHHACLPPGDHERDHTERKPGAGGLWRPQPRPS